MKKYKRSIEITNENFVEISLMPCVRDVRKCFEVREGISSMFTAPVLRLYVGNGNGEIGDCLVEDACGNWHIMTKFDYENVKNQTI